MALSYQKKISELGHTADLALIQYSSSPKPFGAGSVNTPTSYERVILPPVLTASKYRSIL